MDHSPDQPLDLFSTLLMTLVCAIWGGAFVAIKIGLWDMPPLGSAALRFLLTTLVLLIWARIQHVPLLYQWPEVRVLAVIAFLFFYFNLMVYLGTARTTSGRATVFFYSQPVFLAVLAHYFLPVEPLELRRQGEEAFACLLRSSPVNSLVHVQETFWENSVPSPCGRGKKHSIFTR